VDALEPEEIESINASTFQKTTHIFCGQQGAAFKWNPSQAKGFVMKAKQALGRVMAWSRQTFEQVAGCGVVEELEAEDWGEVDDTIFREAENLWSRIKQKGSLQQRHRQIKALAAKAASAYEASDWTKITVERFKNFVSGFSPETIAGMQPKIFRESIEYWKNATRIRTGRQTKGVWSQAQMSILGNKVVSAFGRPEQWDAETVENLGELAATQDAQELGKLPEEYMDKLSGMAVELMGPAHMRALGSKVARLSEEAKRHVSGDKLDSLAPADKRAIMQCDSPNSKCAIFSTNNVVDFKFKTENQTEPLTEEMLARLLDDMAAEACAKTSISPETCAEETVLQRYRDKFEGLTRVDVEPSTAENPGRRLLQTVEDDGSDDEVVEELTARYYAATHAEAAQAASDAANSDAAASVGSMATTSSCVSDCDSLCPQAKECMARVGPRWDWTCTDPNLIQKQCS